VGIKNQVDKLQFDVSNNLKVVESGVFNPYKGESESGQHVGAGTTQLPFEPTDHFIRAVDIWLRCAVVDIRVRVLCYIDESNFITVFDETFAVVDNYKRRITFPATYKATIMIGGSVGGSSAFYQVSTSSLPLEVDITS